MTIGNAYYSHSYHGERTPILVLRRVLAVLAYTAKANPRVIALMLGLETTEDLAQLVAECSAANKGTQCTSPLCLILEFLGDEMLSKNGDILEGAMQLVSLLVSPLLTFEEVEERKRIASEEAAAKEAAVKETAAKEAAEAAATADESSSMDVATPTTPSTSESSTTAAEATTTTTTEETAPAATTTTSTDETTPLVSSSTTTTTEPTATESTKLLCPSIPAVYLRHLPCALTFDSCSERTYQYALEILHHLCANDDNRLCLLEELLSTATTLGQHVTNNLLALKDQLSASSLGSVAMSVVATNSVHEVAFLRLLKLMHTLGSSLPTSRLSLDALWMALDQCLAVVNACLPNADGDKPEDATTTTPSSTSATTTTTTTSSSTTTTTATGTSGGAAPWSPIVPVVPPTAEEEEEEEEAGGGGEGAAQGDASTASPVLGLLLPVIEAYFIIMESQPESEGEPSITHSASSCSRGVSLTQSVDGAERSALGQFIARNRRILNDLIRLNNTLLHRSFKSIIRFPQYLEFDNKRAYFRAKLRDNDAREHVRYGGVRITVNRATVFYESYQALKPLAPQELKGRLTVHFNGEEGIDAGGVLRDWYDTISQEIFNPNYALFTQAADSCFQPNKLSSCNPDHLDYFKFCGRVIAKAIYDGCLMDAHFTRSFYKHMLGKRVTWRDLEPADPEYFKNLQWILENEVTSDLELTFSITVNRFGKVQIVDLKPGGRDILVSEENKHEYVQLLAEMLVTDAIKEQIDAFAAGLWEIIPKELLSIFNEGELELLISGLPEISIDDLRRNTEYSGFKPDSPIIQRFWNVLYSFDSEERALFLQFVTGSSKVPLEGFKALMGMGRPQRFNIHRVPDTDRLPTAHTWYVSHNCKSTCQQQVSVVASGDQAS
jgi:hypothetical protein